MALDVILRGVPWSLLASSGFVPQTCNLVVKDEELLKEAVDLYVSFCDTITQGNHRPGAIVAAAALVLSVAYRNFVMSQPDDSLHKILLRALEEKIGEASTIPLEVMMNDGTKH